MTPVQPQISKFKAEKSCQVGFNILQRLYSRFTVFKKIGSEVVLAARWRLKAEMTSPFDSPTPILYRLSVEIFRLSLTAQKLSAVYLGALEEGVVTNLPPLGSQLVDEIGSKFQRLPHVFGIQQLN